MTDILATITRNKKPFTTVPAADVTEFNVHVDKGAGGYDIMASLNGKTTMIGFALRARGGGYTFTSLNLTQFPESLRMQAELLSWHGLDAKADSGLTLAEVRKRAAVLGGIWLAGKTLA